VTLRDDDERNVTLSRARRAEPAGLSPPREEDRVAPIMAEVNVSRPPAGSHVTIWLDFRGHGAGAILLPLVIRQARKEVPRSCQNLKRRLEAGP
jgi:hypothetical protein